MRDPTTWTTLIASAGTLLGGLGGYWLAGRNEEGRDKRAAAREADSRHAALAERLEEQRHSFQLETLLALQDDLQGLSRSTAKISSADIQTLMQGNGLQRLSDELSETWRLAAVSVQRLQTRVLDAALRDGIRKFSDTCTSLAVLRAAETGESMEDRLARFRRQAAELATAYAALNEQLGELIRREMDRRPAGTEPS